jgi:tetratricopeptide (TPR) repeat protein
MRGIKSLIFFLLVFIGQNLSAQDLTQKIDSLLTVLKTAQQDTGRVNLLNQLSSFYINEGNVIGANRFADSALELAVKLNFKKGIAAAYRNSGAVDRSQGNYSEALKKFNAALKICEEIGDKQGIAKSARNIGAIYNNLGNYSEALSHVQIALTFSTEIRDKQGIASCLNTLGLIHEDQGNYPEAVKNFQASLKIAKEAGDKKGIAAALNNMGIAYDYQGQYTFSLRNYIDALKIFEEIGDKSAAANSLINIGFVYSSQQNYSETLKSLQQALNLFKEMNDQAGIALCYNNIGNIYHTQCNYEEALNFVLPSLRIYQQIGDKNGIALANNNLGQIYQKKGNFPEALKHLRISLKIYQESNAQGEIANIDVLLGRTLFGQAEKENDQDAKQNMTEAIQYLTNGLKLAKEVGAPGTARDAYECLSEVYKDLNDYQKALSYHIFYTELKDSLMNNETTYKLEQQRTQFEVDKAVADEKTEREKLLSEQKFKNEKAVAIEKLKYQFALTAEKAEHEKKLTSQKFESEKMMADENTRHQQALSEQKMLQQKMEANAKTALLKEKADRKRKNELFVLGVGILSVMSLFGFLFIRQRNQKRKAVEKAEMLHKMAELELQSLRAQLNPHFMFNSLNAIQDLIVNEDSDRSHLYLSRFSKLLRMLLDNANLPFVSIKQEIEFLELYLSLENLRIPDLQFSIEKDATINSEERMIPNMMLQPYIENAIWHGLSNKNGDRKLQIRIHENGNATEFEIEDNGIGRKKAAELRQLFFKGHHSKGMELLSKRFNLLSKEYGTSIHTTVTDLEHNGEMTGTLVKIDVPFSLSEQAKQLAHDTNNHN